MTTTTASALAHALADILADPDTAPPGAWATPQYRQSLAYGPPGIALLHIERAAAGLGPWQRAHQWLAAAARQPLTTGPDSHPFHGAPAVAYALACAADHLPGSYQRTLETLEAEVATDVRRRLDAAHRRMDAGRLPALAEFDAIRGLTGYGAHFLHRDPTGPTMRAVLDYCVRLTRPIDHNGLPVPGWWTPTGPSGRPDERFPGGHANNGMAHGIAGVLALLALAARRGVLVNGHHQALRTILAWLDQWGRDTGHGPAWPYWITRHELDMGRVAASPPRRPSWCYGTVGLARAQQLAALALGDTARQAHAEHALVSALTDPAQLRTTTDKGLCHGFAGLAHVTARVADDAAPATAERLHALLPGLLDEVHPPGTKPATVSQTLVHNEQHGPGLLDGAAGIALALTSLGTTGPPRSAWDSFLLIS